MTSIDRERILYIVPNFGLGDLLLVIGAVKYYAKFYHQVIVSCPKNFIANVIPFYCDNSKIKVETSENLENQIMNDFYGHEFILCAFHKSFKQLGPGTFYFSDVGIIPETYFNDLKVKHDIVQDHCYFKDTVTSQLLYNLVKDRKFIFIHNQSATHTFDASFLLSKKNNYYLINASYNMYNEGDIEYALMNRFINRLIIDYKHIIENCEELYLIDSCFKAFSYNLDLSKVKVKHLYIRGSNGFSRYNDYYESGFEKHWI